MSQIAKQMIVVSEGSYNENQLGEKVSLFNEDGSVFVGGGSTSEPEGAVGSIKVTRLQNQLVANSTPVQFTDIRFSGENPILEWDEFSPSRLTAVKDGTVLVWANLTSLGTSYTPDGTDNSDLQYAIVKNYPGLPEAALDYMESVITVSHDGGGAECDTIPPNLLEVTVGDYLEVIVINNNDTHTLLESNPGPALNPGSHHSDTPGPGVIGPVFMAIPVQGTVVGPAGPSSSGGYLYGSSGDPNLDAEVPSPPDNVAKARAYDVDDSDKLYYWDEVGIVSTAEVDTFTGSNGTVIETGTYTGPNGEEYTKRGPVTIQSNTCTTVGSVFHEGIWRETGSADGKLSVKIASPGADKYGLRLRCTDYENYVAVYIDHDTDDVKIAVQYGATWAVIKTWVDAGLSPTGKVLACEFIGATYKVWFDGVELGTFTDPGDNFLTPTKHGVVSYGSAAGFDDLTWTPPGGEASGPGWYPFSPAKYLGA